MDAAFLQTTPLFAGFDPLSLQEIARLAARRSYQPGAVVLRQGELGRHFFIILSGEAEVIQESTTGQQTVIARFGPGDHFGERAALRMGSRTATVVACDALECAVLTQWDVLAVLRSQPTMAAEFLQRLRSRYLPSVE